MNAKLLSHLEQFGLSKLGPAYGRELSDHVSRRHPTRHTRHAWWLPSTANIHRGPADQLLANTYLQLVLSAFVLRQWLGMVANNIDSDQPRRVCIGIPRRIRRMFFSPA